MSLLNEAFKIKKENNGLLCRAVLMRKLKINSALADNLMVEVEKHLIESSKFTEETKENNNQLIEESANLLECTTNNLKKIEIHICAEYK